MKTWQGVFFGSVLGLLMSGVILLIITPRFDQGVILLPSKKPALLTVYVTGEVQQPGVYEFQPGSRLRDAVSMAGGFTLEADQIGINLASLLEDEDRINIPKAAIAGEIQTNRPGEGGHLVNINTADIDELDTLPGIGLVKAQAIIDYRDQNGLFLSVNDLINVPGFGQELLEQVLDRITVNP